MVPRAAGLLPVGGRARTTGCSNFGGPAWEPYDGRFYYHAYLREQPDLDWRNPEVRAAMLDVLRFWCERGADGFRIDALRQLIKDDQRRDNPPNPAWREGEDPYSALVPEFTTDRPEVQDAIRDMRAAVGDRAAADRRAVPADRAARRLLRLRAWTCRRTSTCSTTPWEPRAIADLVERYEAALPDGAWPNWVLGNHDRPRVATRVGRPGARRRDPAADAARHADAVLRRRARHARRRDRARAARRPVGFGNRDPVRTPMQWDAEGLVHRPASRGCRSRPITPPSTSPPSATTRTRCCRLYRALLARGAGSPTCSTAPTARCGLGDVLRFARGDSIEVRIDFAAGDGEILKHGVRGPRSGPHDPSARQDAVTLRFPAVLRRADPQHRARRARVPDGEATRG